MRACAPYLAMIFVSLAYGGSNILSKLALEEGLSYYVFTVYRHLIATAILGPLAYLLERKQRPSLTLPILAKIFVLALIGTAVHQNVYYAGLDCTSPTVATALSNVIPALTFVLAVLLRIERVSIKSANGRAKLLGTIICITGVLVFTFWKGYMFKGVVTRPLIVVHGAFPGRAAIHGKDNLLKGSALVLTSYVAFSAWLTLQVMVCKVYPARLSMNALMCFFASLQSSVPALIFERKNIGAWRLDWNVQLLTLTYCGTVISCLSYYLQTFCINKRGPTFAAMFSPLVLVIVGIFSASLFAERIHIGSLIGAILIILGLYCVLWGKSRDFDESTEKNMKEGCEPNKSSKELQQENIITLLNRESMV